MSEQAKRLAIEMLLDDPRREVYEAASVLSGQHPSGHFHLTFSNGVGPQLDSRDVAELVRDGWILSGTFESGYRRGPKLNK